MKRTIEFQITELLGIGMTLVVLGIGVAFGLQIMGETKDDIGVASCAQNSASYPSYITYNATGNKMCCNTTGGCTAVVTAEWNGTSDAITGVAKIPEKLPTIATVIVAGVIIGILVTYLWGRFQ